MTHARHFALPPRRHPILAGTVILGVALLAGCGDAASTTVGSTAASTAVSGPTTGPGTASAAADPSGSSTGLTLRGGWVLATQTTMTAIYGTLDNPTNAPITVTAVSSPVAEQVTFHEMSAQGGSATMKAMSGSLTIPAHGTHVLQPGGDHLMMMGLRQPVTVGQPVTATLTLQGGGSVTISVPGKDDGAATGSPMSTMAGMTS
jgi:copper(I)-binding protein